MKKTLKLLAALLALCMIITAGLPVGLAAEEAAPQADLLDLRALVGSAQPGGTITLTGDAEVGAGYMDTPWIIDRNITIDGQGHIVYVRAGGILLDAESVTFKDVDLRLVHSSSRNAIIANGHALTLNNVKAGAKSINVFCGTLLPAEYEKSDFTVPAPGQTGEVTIKGKTNLQGGDLSSGGANIFAGSLCMGGMDQDHNGPSDNGPANEFNGGAVIRVEDRDGRTALGTIYGGGGQQRIPENALSGKETTPNPLAYTVSGAVTISGPAIPDVDGGGSAATDVVYEGSGIEGTANLQNISSLSVESGRLVLDSLSGFRENGALSVASGAVLDLTNFAVTDIPVHTFRGEGGILILAQNQIWSVEGLAEGAAKVAVGGINYDNTQSTAVPAQGHMYIKTPASSSAAFQLLPYVTYPDMELVQDADGRWTVSGGSAGEDINRVTSFQILEEKAAATVGEEAYIKMEAQFETEAFAALDFIPLTILVNGRGLTPVEDTENDGYYIYTTMLGELTITVRDNFLCITPNGGDSIGNYTIQVSIPDQYSAAGRLTDTVVLTVADEGGAVPPTPTSVQPPEAVEGLRYTGLSQTGVKEGTGYTLTGHTAINVGKYTATAALEPGYQWEDGSTQAKSIPWSIGKALTDAPVGLSAKAPASAGASDGAITGTSAAMEYAGNEDFADAESCAEGETGGLPAGSYFVRYKETDTHEAGDAVLIKVPAYGEFTVVSISVNSTGHRTEYTVGDRLDVSGLTIEAVYSDQSRQTVAVTQSMVGGFDSSAAGSRTLTISYKGARTTYTVEISDPEPGHTHQWGDGWSHDAGYHWHECGAQGCPVKENKEKDGYAAHTPGAWITDQGATASRPGSRHRECTVCGYETARETIPATGGGSTGGDWYPDVPDNMTGSTQRNPDGSTTTVSTNRFTGAVTTTVRRPDGSQTVVVAASDGTVTTTEREKDGSTVRTVRRPDGSSAITWNRADQVNAQATQDRYGRVQAQVKIPAKVTQAVQREDGVITLPVPPIPVTWNGTSSVAIQTGRDQPVKVEIPLEGAAPGAVAVLIRPDGSQEVVRTSALTGSGLLLEVSNGAVVTVKDNGTLFSDTSGHWAQDAIQFVSARELFRGESSSAFSPGGAMTRAMLVTVLARLDGADAKQGGSWYAGGLEWAVAQGVSDGSNPSGLVTREQLAAMLYRYAGSPKAAGSQLYFSDAQAVSGYAREAVAWAVENGILNGYGDGRLIPGGSATRAETAAMLMRYINLSNKP